MKIKPGPTINRYADMVGASSDEVIDWISGYVNGPWLPETEKWIEKTEQERLNSIREYIELRLENSVAARIKHEKLAERMEQEENKHKVTECPF